MAPVDPAKEETFHVLMTGFGLFRGLPTNPSWLAVKRLHNTTIPVSPSKENPRVKQIHITAIEMPVVYDSVLEILPGLHQAPPVLPVELRDDATFPTPPVDGYDFFFHVGLGQPQPMRLERQAHKSGYEARDVEGKQGPLCSDNTRGFGKGYEQFGSEIKTSIDLDSLVAELDKERSKMIISLDPGRYLCDFIYYCSLAEAEKSRLLKESDHARPVLFLHCSPVGKPTSTEDLVIGITRIVEWVQAKA